MAFQSTPATPAYTKVRYWVQNYAPPGVDDSRAAKDYVVVEPAEAVNSLRAELIAMSKGSYRDEILDKFLGQSRRSRHGSYAEWAKSMLMWIANVKQ